MTPERRFMPFWTEKSPHLRGTVVNFVVTRKIEGFARPHQRNPDLYKGSKLQPKLWAQSLFKILQTLSVKTPHLGSDDTLGGGGAGRGSRGGATPSVGSITHRR
jgi:hypothetical protein